MTSIWLDEIAPDIHPRLEEDTSADVAIVGAGIAGVATAYHVSRSGAKVVVLEARMVAEAASGRNAGFLLAGVAENFVAAARRYGEDRALRRLADRRLIDFVKFETGGLPFELGADRRR